MWTIWPSKNNPSGVSTKSSLWYVVYVIPKKTYAAIFLHTLFTAHKDHPKEDVCQNRRKNTKQILRN